MFKWRNPFKKEKDGTEWIVSLIIALARLNFIKPEVLNRELNNFNKNKNYLIKLVNGKL